ncbi:MAG: TylF/MycF/NovP-related O-methyltransferase [Bacteroidota bacterium]|nr:TylF/MycF/NovP-related O-methyltransferase [Bacteroidota bacterium]
MSNSLKEALIRTVSCSLMRRLRCLTGRRIIPIGKMRFPPFDSQAHERLAQDRDYVRYTTIALALERLRTENIPGALAELGVYRGETSAVLHRLCPERELFLFDTFEGFPRDGKDTAEDTRFRNTSVERVLETIGDTKNIVVRKGYVPSTFQDLEHHSFAFVLLDLDLYEPTRCSLEFFYPRIPPGGYIMVHDYNSPESDWACKRAVDEFMKDKPERVLDIPDEWGSVLFRRSV